MSSTMEKTRPVKAIIPVAIELRAVAMLPAFRPSRNGRTVSRWGTNQPKKMAAAA